MSTPRIAALFVLTFVPYLVLWCCEVAAWPVLGKYHVTDWQFWLVVAVNGFVISGLKSAWREFKKQNVYRVSTINQQGVLTDLPWDGVKEFCQARGLKWVPELFRWQTYHLDDLECWLDIRYTDIEPEYLNEKPLSLSDKKTVDEGVCLRQEGLVPLILKAKSPKFLEHETKLLDKGEVDMESAA